MSSMHVKKGDTVKILSGKDKGKTGEILRSIPQRQRVVVEKCNMVKNGYAPHPSRTRRAASPPLRLLFTFPT